MNPYDELDIDWTIVPGDYPRELTLREHRNILIREQFERGETVAYRQSGWSCYPVIRSNDLCHYKPVFPRDLLSLKVNDIVFCAVEPGWRYYAHFIKKIEWRWHQGKMDLCFTIANKQGRENGWCWSHMIWGKLFQINDRPYQVE